MPQQVSYDFEWNSVKALANLHKHGVSFDQAATVFLGALALTVFDETHSALKERWFTLDTMRTAHCWLLHIHIK